MSIAEKVCNFNSDGSVRAEFVIIGYGVMPLDYFAKIWGVRVADAINWENSDLRGLLLNARCVNDEGQKCNENGTPVEDEDFALLPGNKVDEWNHQLWVNYDGTSALTDEDWEKLSADDKASYRRLNCMEVHFVSGMKLFPTVSTAYITEEAVSTLAEMLAMDVLIGDQVVKRYQHECKFNENFAQKYGFALEMALDELREEADHEDLRRQLMRELMVAWGHNKNFRPHSENFHAMIFSPCTVNKNGNEEVSESGDDNPTEPISEEDASTHD